MGFGVWTLVRKEDGAIIGRAGYSVRSGFDDVELGFLVGMDYQRQGYATEALSCVLDLLFDRMKINRAEGQCDVRNPASARVMEKCGMRREGLLRQRVCNKGEMVDVLLFAAIAADRKK